MGISGFGIDVNVSVANGNVLNIVGFIEVFITIPDFNIELPVPVLVVPYTQTFNTCPVNLSANVIT